MKRPPLLNLISIVLPILGTITYVVIEANQSPNFIRTIVLQVLALLGTFLPGFVLSVMAYCRSERYWAITLLGFLLNLPVPIVVVLFATGTLEQVGRVLFPI